MRVGEEGNDAESLNDLSSIFKSRKALQQVVQDSTEQSSITNLKRFSNLIALLLLALAIVGYLMTDQEYSKINAYSKLLVTQQRMAAELLYIQGNVRDLKFLNLGILTANASSQGIEQQLRSEINGSLSLIQDLQKTLSFSTEPISAEELNLIQNSVITMTFSKLSLLIPTLICLPTESFACLL